MADEQVAVEEFKHLLADPAAREAFVALKRAKSEGSRYRHVFQVVFGSPWAIYEPYMELIANVLVDRVLGVQISAEEMADRIEAARRPAPAPAKPGVAVIPIHGAIVPKASMFSEVSGATSVEGIRASFREALASPQVSAIAFDIDSPGGAVTGIPELAAEIRAARGQKPLLAFTSGMAASAAYWLASQADEIVASRSALVGSIGVITAHEDMTAAAEKQGVKVSLISAGKFKTEGNPFEPLSDEGRAHVQSMVDEFYGMFVGDVAKGRGRPIADVRGGFGQGRLVSSSRGVVEGMVDRIGSLEGEVRSLLRSPAEALAPAVSISPDVAEIFSTSASANSPGLQASPSTNAAPGPPESPDPEPEPAEEAPEPETVEIDAEVALLRERPKPQPW